MKRRVMALTAAAIFVSPAAAFADATIQAVDGTAADPNNNRWDAGHGDGQGRRAGHLVLRRHRDRAQREVRLPQLGALQTPFAAAGAPGDVTVHHAGDIRVPLRAAQGDDEGHGRR